MIKINKIKKDNYLTKQETHNKINQFYRKKINFIKIINQLFNKIYLSESYRKRPFQLKILKKIKLSNLKNKLNLHKNLINNKSLLKINSHLLQINNCKLIKLPNYHKNRNKSNKSQLKKVVQVKRQKTKLLCLSNKINQHKIYKKIN